MTRALRKRQGFDQIGAGLNVMASVLSHRPEAQAISASLFLWATRGKIQE
jgi:hypothetical protein